MTFALVHHPGYVAELPAGHSFPMSKYALFLEALAGADYDSHAPDAAPIEWLTAVHDPVARRRSYTLLAREFGMVTPERALQAA